MKSEQVRAAKMGCISAKSKLGKAIGNAFADGKQLK